ncbi:MAG: DUF3422 domain-containing protein [Rhodobacteraceae bacterium]|nr:DUF3422 domain-containing protein [Paracoccaceae bacterium]
MAPIQDHPLRYKLANELHARPFPTLEAPCHAAYLAIKQPHDAAGRDREADLAHLTALLDRFGAKHPQPGATHYFGDLGKHKLKWEQHTEFVTYTIFVDGVAEKPFDPDSFKVFPEDWLDEMPGTRVTSALIRVNVIRDEDEIQSDIAEWFVPESVAASRVLDDAAIVAGDFRIDTGGHMRFAVYVRPETGARRVGRIVQRLCEIETYKTVSMLGFARAREMSPRMAEIDTDLTRIVGDTCAAEVQSDATLKALLNISSELENLIATSSFRFGATGAYEALVEQRIKVLRETRFKGRQTLAEFMTRRFDPAMRTVKATEQRLQSMAAASIRAGELLRTQVDVDRQAQNQRLLESMDTRAALQLRLQKTVEGLSVVAISYYAVNLASYLAYPLSEPMGLSKGMVTAILTLPVVLGVWLLVHRIRESMEHAPEGDL